MLNWANYFAGSEEHSIEVRLQLAEAERDNGGKGVVMGLESVVVGKEEGEAIVCVVCQDSVHVGELVKKLPCRRGEE
ncbi:hypothetical protein LIER_20167 [Lithospermum erythrorhizon]|uniref:Uncharacterized protein n=1 Tax=Lithospermum erythrorhizon TaxID=34254 RepID=A0AAV3QNJ1_LITER